MFGSDFKQILLIILKASHQDIVHVTINSFYLWNEYKVMKLLKNMILQSGVVDGNNDNIKEFSN